MSLERLDYADGAVPLAGRLARPAGTPRAAVLVFPTIANVTPAVERRAEMLADLGYLAIIADFYGEPVPDFAAAGPLAEKLRRNWSGYRTRLQAGLSGLRSLPEAAGLRIAAVGYCMGGQAALELARSGAEIEAAVSFHGILHTDMPAQPGVVKARLLVCHGDADPMAPRSHVTRLWEEMDAAAVRWHFHSYSGVKHGFTDPGSDARGIEAIAYDASADRQSWAAMTALLDEIF